MKKLRFLSAVMATVLLLLLLSACQPVPGNPENPTSSTPSSSVTPPSSSVPPTVPTTQPTQPTTQPTEPTTQPTTPIENPAWADGFAFIFSGHQPTIRFEVDLSKLVKEHLYYVDLNTQKITSICAEPIVTICHDRSETELLYFVKASEPTKIYQTAKKDLNSHTVLYESAYGPINDITRNDYTITEQKILGFVADNKKFIVLDLETGETTLVMEQYYIRSAFFEYGIHSTWNEHKYVIFFGKLSEDDTIKHYLYDRDTGAVEAEEDTYDD